MHFNFSSTQSLIVDHLQSAGYSCWVVGGAIRDLLRQKAYKDIDFVTNATPLEVRSILSKEQLFFIPDQKAFEHGINRIVDQKTGLIIDLATMRKDDQSDGRWANVSWTQNIIEDLSRRDFTINAIAAAVSSQGKVSELIDPFGGQQDIIDKVVRFVGNPLDRIEEDALRMIRACRFTALGEEWYSPETFIIRSKANNISSISKERIRDEILKGLQYSKPSNFFRSLRESQLLEIIWPDLNACWNVEQNSHHIESVFDHLMRTVDASVELSDKTLLRLAALTHDIGKPPTKTIDATGIHFYKHEIEGSVLIYRWMKQYHFSNNEIAYVTKMVRHHQFRFDDASKPKAIRKWLHEVGKDDWRDLFILRSMDRAGNLLKMQQGKSIVTSKMRELSEIIENMIISKIPIFKEDLAITGEDIKTLGISTGPIYKEIFSNILGLILNDPSKNNKKWLLAYVEKMYGKKNNII